MCDGKALVDHPLFGCDSKALQLVAYYDELEVCNPLGAAAKRHKVGAFLGAAAGSPYIVFISTSGMLRSSDIYIYIYIYI